MADTGIPDVMNGDPSGSWDTMSPTQKIQFAGNMISGTISALAGYQVAKYSQDIMEAESAMAETRMRQDTRERSKIREMRYLQAKEDQAFKQALSGTTSQAVGPGQSEIAYQEDEIAAQESLQDAVKAERYKTWQQKATSKRESKASLMSSISNQLNTLSSGLE